MKTSKKVKLKVVLIARTEAKYLVSVLNLLRFPWGNSHRRNLSLKRCRKPQTSNVLKEANSKLKTVKKSCLEIALVLWNATSEVKMEARSEISMKFCIKYGSAGSFHDWMTYPNQWSKALMRFVVVVWDVLVLFAQTITGFMFWCDLFMLSCFLLKRDKKMLHTQAKRPHEGDDNRPEIKGEGIPGTTHSLF